MVSKDWLINISEDVFTSQDNAIEVAYENLTCIPAAVSAWLSEACDEADTDRMVHNPYRLAHATNMTPAQALAVLFGGTNAAALQALHTLRAMYRDSVSDDAHAIGSEAWEKQCLEDKHIINMGRDYD